MEEAPAPAPAQMKCPYCGTRQVRLSARQSHKRPVEIYRCTKCKRHFEKVAPNANRSLGNNPVVIGVLAVLALVSVLLVILFSGDESDSLSSPAISSPLDPNTPAPVAGADMESQYRRGLHYWTMGDYKQALPWVKSAADQGHRESRYYLGLAYLYGRATVQNYRMAFEQIQLSAKQNYLQAQHQLGLLFRDGQGAASNREQAYIWLNIAASRGHEAATHDRDKLAMTMSNDEVAAAQDGTMKELAILRGAAGAGDVMPASAPAAPVPAPAAPAAAAKTTP